MIELLSFLLKKENYQNYYHSIPKNDDKTLTTLFAKLSELHNSLMRDISWDEYAVFVLSSWPNVRKTDKDEREIAQSMLDRARSSTLAEDAAVLLLNGLQERHKAVELGMRLLDFGENGKGSKDDLMAALSEFGNHQSVCEEFEYVTTDLEELYKATVLQPGLRWRLDCLNRAMGSLRKGNFGFIFKRPECFAKGTKVLLADGRSREIEKLTPGTKVMGPDSLPRHVVAVSKGTEKMYRVSYAWGDSYVCNESHVLQLRAEGNTVTQVKVKDYLDWSGKLKHRFKQYKANGIDLPERSDLKLDPYVLGVWLGDGTSSGPTFTNADPEIRDYLKKWAESVGLVYKEFVRENQGKAVSISISSLNRKHGANHFTQFLKASRLYKNKHIPQKYLLSSRDQRLELLAGLIDTDGWKEKNSLHFCNLNKRLSEQVTWLARSLGLHATMTKKVGAVNDYWNVNMYGDLSIVPLRVVYKRCEKSSKTPKRNGLNFGFTITEEPSCTEYYGIQVDVDSLYLLEDFTVVHNTGGTTFLASELTHMIGQTDGDVLWANNEQVGAEVLLRIYEAYFGLSLKALALDLKKYKAEFHKGVGQRFKMLDRASIGKKDIERFLESTNPAILVIDQIDKIKGFDGDREDIRYGKIYQWARELAKTYCPIIGVCQAAGSGEGKKWLTMDDVAEAKTAKQAEADWILGIGKVHDVSLQYVRYLHLCKNKLPGDQDTQPELRHGRFEVVIEPEIARYKDI